MVPRGAWFQDTGGSWVYVLQGWRGREAGRGARPPEPHHYEVRSGLQPGDTILTSRYEAFNNAGEVLLEEPATSNIQHSNLQPNLHPMSLIQTIALSKTYRTDEVETTALTPWTSPSVPASSWPSWAPAAAGKAPCSTSRPAGQPHQRAVPAERYRRERAHRTPARRPAEAAAGLRVPELQPDR